MGKPLKMELSRGSDVRFLRLIMPTRNPLFFVSKKREMDAYRTGVTMRTKTDVGTPVRETIANSSLLNHSQGFTRRANIYVYSGCRLECSTKVG